MDPANQEVRHRRARRSDGLLDEFSSALDSIRARPGEPGRGRHNLSEEILGGLMYPFGNRFGNEHARSVFKASPAAFTYLSGEEAPPLPWGTYKGRGRDMSAARLAREQGRDLDSVTSRLQELESAQSCLPGDLPGNGKAQSSPIDPLALAGQALSGVVGAIGDFFSPSEAHAETSADTGNVASEAPVEANPAEMAENTTKTSNLNQYHDDGSGEGPFYPIDTASSSAATSSSPPNPNQATNNSEVIQPEVREKKYRELSDEEREKVIQEAKKHEGLYYQPEKNGENGDGIDCSHLAAKAYKNAGFDYGYTPSYDLPKTGNVHFVAVTEPKKGDLVYFDKPRHVGFYDPSGLDKGETPYSATSHGVRRSSYTGWSGGPTYFRAMVSN